MESMVRKLAAERQVRTRFTSHSAKEASDQFWKGRVSADAHGLDEEEEGKDYTRARS